MEVAKVLPADLFKEKLGNAIKWLREGLPIEMDKDYYVSGVIMGMAIEHDAALKKIEEGLLKAPPVVLAILCRHHLADFLPESEESKKGTTSKREHTLKLMGTLLRNLVCAPFFPPELGEAVAALLEELPHLDGRQVDKVRRYLALFVDLSVHILCEANVRASGNVHIGAPVAEIEEEK